MFMRFVLAATVIAAFATPAVAGDTYVHSYVRKDGTYVQGYHRTTPDSNPYNNYSTQGNVNPWTGKSGTVDPNRNSDNHRYRSNANSGYGYYD